MQMFFHGRLSSALLTTAMILGVAMNAHAATTLGTVALASSGYPTTLGAATVSLSVVRTGGAGGAASVGFGTHGVTATSGHNYSGKTGILKWTAGDASPKTITVTLDATKFTGSKTFNVTLVNAVGASLGTPATAAVTINSSPTGAPPVTPPPVTPPPVVAPPATGGGPAAKLAAKLGAPARLLVGVGAQGPTVDPVSAVLSQSAKVDIYERYLGTGDWTSWNSAPCNYVCVVADAAQQLGAVPMYTQYQMANDGDGNLAGINDASFMATYWSRVRLLFQTIATSGKPALVNLEPDFWGYVERQAPNADPTRMTAVVSSNADCSAQPNNVTGIAQCLLAMARKYAPKAYVGFPPSDWGGDTTADVVAFMNAVGAQKADFIVEQTLDRDAGCFEVQTPVCNRAGSGWYWDETNQTHPNFQDNLTEAAAFHTGMGNLPVIWWQTPEGVPATTRGGRVNHYRDNRMNYFLTHPAELVAAGGLGVVFSTGENSQTNITTDAGQFQLLDSRYIAAPAPLP